MPGADNNKLEVKVSPSNIVIGLAVVLILGVFGWLTFGLEDPAARAAGPLPTQARDYLENLTLEDVRMQASESMANGRLIGNPRHHPGNHGTRKVKLAEVTCVFRDYGEQVVKRELVPIVGGATGSGVLYPGQARNFRLPFDNIPESWNQVMPTMVIAQIQFE